MNKMSSTHMLLSEILVIRKVFSTCNVPDKLLQFIFYYECFQDTRERQNQIKRAVCGFSDILF